MCCNMSRNYGLPFTAVYTYRISTETIPETENINLYFLLSLLHYKLFFCIFLYFDSLSGPRLPHRWGFVITFRHTTLCRTSLDEWSDRRTDLYLTAHNTHNRQKSMPPAVFEPAIPASERSQTHALDRAAAGIGDFPVYRWQFSDLYTEFLTLGTLLSMIFRN
jgi:hypothetical protein